jgi:flagellar assembly protein FliH
VDRTDDAPGGETIEAAFDKGLAQGRADAMATYRKRVDRAVAALEAALREMGAMRKKEVACLEAETLRLAMAIAKKIVGWETAHGPVILHAIRKAMEKVTEPQPLTLKVNPADIDTVNRLNADQELSGRCDHRISIAADDRVAPGGCIIETPFGDVDARIDRQIAVVEAVLSARLPDPAEKG